MKKRVVITVFMSALAGFLAALWRTALDPTGTGGSILALPIIIVMVPLCIAFFVLGLFTTDRPFGLPLILAAVLIPISFVFINGLL